MTLPRPTVAGVVVTACGGAAAWIFAGLAVITVVHVDDDYRGGHVSGAWMALAQSLDEGALYPPLYDGEHFGGTRFMPLQIFLHGGLAKLTGEYVVSGKLLAAAIGVGLLATVFLFLRDRLGVPRWLGLVLVATLVPTHSGLNALTSIRGDALPVALQLAAIFVVTRWTTPRATAGAGLLCTAALLSKISAIWAPAAIVIWLIARDRRRLPGFVSVLLSSTAVSFLLVELASGGRFSDNVVGLATSALEHPGGVPRALTAKPLGLIDGDAPATAILLPLALADLVLALRAREPAIVHVAFGASLVVTLVLMADVGVVSNHLLDLEVLTLLLVGHLWARHAADMPTVSFGAVLVPIAALWAALGPYVIDMHPDVRTAVRIAAGRSASPSESLSDVLAADARLLSEDPTFEVTRSRQPTVLDPFTLLRVLRKHPEWRADLVGRLDRREFDRVVLRADHVEPNGRIDVSHLRWRREHFGPAVIAAIARNYHFRAFVESYAVYAPA